MLRLDIALVVHNFDLSEGTGGYVVQLASRLAQQHRVTIYAAAVRAPVPQGATVVPVRALRGRTYATMLTFPAAFAAVRQQHDIVHAQGWVTHRADVVTAHIVLGAWRDRARAAGIRSPIGERWLGGLVTRREATLYRENARAVIAPSQQVKADLARLYGRDRDVHVIPHGFGSSNGEEGEEARSQARATLGLPRDHFVALYVGDARKGLARTLEAIALTPGVHLLVLSGSSRDAFLSQARELGLADRVHWAGHLSDPSVGYAAADVLVHPTIYDSFALVVAEAMARGLPVIVSRAAGISELLKHQISAWLLDAPTATETAAAIGTLAREPEVRRRLAEGAREVAARRPWDDVAEETLAVYDSLRPGSG